MTQASATSRIGAVDGVTANTRSYIELVGVSKSFDGFLAVNNIDLSIRKGEIFALLGASGCGKSTLLRMLSGVYDQAARAAASL